MRPRRARWLATWWMLDDLDRLARGDLGLGTHTDAAARAAALDAAARRAPA